MARGTELLYEKKAIRNRRKARLKLSQWERSVPLIAASVWDFPKHDIHSAWVSSACRGDVQVLQWRCGICNNVVKFALLVRLLDRCRMAAGDDRICKLAAAKGPIRLLRRFISGFQRGRVFVAEEKTSELRQRSGLHIHRLARCRLNIVSFFSTARNQWTCSYTAWLKKGFSWRGNIFFSIQASWTQFKWNIEREWKFPHI